MEDVGQPAPERAGQRLRAAREARGLSLDEVAARTRIPMRHLSAIEAGDYAALPAPTYATGFAKSYARAIGEDEVSIARAVRAELDRSGRAVPQYQPYEAPDPARVPSRGLAVAALGLAMAVAVLAGLYFLTDTFRPGGEANSVAAVPVAVGRSAPASAPAAAPSPTAAGLAAVVLAAVEDEVWMRVYDRTGRTLYIGTLKPGETYTVPADADGPLLNVGRPDELRITVGGTAIPPLGDGRRPIKDVALDGASLVARATVAPAPASAPAAQPRRARPSPRPALTETQAANLRSAATVDPQVTPQP